MESLLIVILVISLLISIYLILAFITTKRDFNILSKKYKEKEKLLEEQKKELNFLEREINRKNEQIKVYEDNEKNITSIEIFGKNTKVNPIYKGKRVLVGDYMESTSENTLNVLKSFGITVDIVRSGKDIVDLIEHGYKYDAIFTNRLYKDGYDGEKTLYRLKKIKNFNTPVVILTVDKDKREEYVENGDFDEYDSKPISVKSIKPILEKIFDSR